MDKLKARALIQTAPIKAELKSMISLVNNVDQGQRRPIKSLKIEVKILKRGMIEAPRLEWWSEHMDSVITPVLELLDKRIKNLEIKSSTGGVGVGVGITDLEVFQENWIGKLNRFAACIDRMVELKGGGWFRSRMESVDFSEKHVPVGKF